MLQEIEYRGCKIRIYPDLEAESPREWANVGTMACWHSRHRLGDEQPKEDPQTYLNRLPKGTIILPLYLYDHSGLTIATHPFSCPWDSGKVGFIYVTPEKAKAEWPKARYWRKAAKRYLEQEVKTYDRWLTGSFLRWESLNEEGEFIDATSSVDDLNYAISEAKASIDSHLARTTEDKNANQMQFELKG